MDISNLEHAKEVLAFQTEAQVYSSLRGWITEDPDLQEDNLLALDDKGNLRETLIKLGKQVRAAAVAAVKLQSVVKEKQAQKNFHITQSSRLREIILRAMQSTGQQKIEAIDLVLVQQRVGSPGVEVVDETLIPHDFCEVKYVPNKSAIRVALQAGREVPGAVLEPVKIGLFIK